MQKIKNFRYFQNIIKYVQEVLLKTEDVLIIKINLYIHIKKENNIYYILFIRIFGESPDYRNS